MEPIPRETAPELLEDLRRRLIIFGGSALAILGAAGVAAYIIFSNREISIDAASISAPLVILSPTAPGRLNAVYANEGDSLPANAPVALVGTEVVKTKKAGLIVQVDGAVGAQVAPGQAVAKMINPAELRVVGKIDENKGLADIRIGDPAAFTVDAFGNERFTGVVDEIVPTSNQSDIVFNISSQRETQQFNIKVRYDTSAYPQLKNGMSARISIYKQ